MNKINVLVTGCGGDIGQSIAKILKSRYPDNRLFGVDIHNDHPGKFIYEQCAIVSPVSASTYLSDLKAVVQDKDIQLIVPASEPELRYFSENDIRAVLGIPLVMASPKALEIGFDKLETARFLHQRGLPAPATYILGEMAAPLTPSIIKNREGSGSKTLIKIKGEKDFFFYQAIYPEFICQEYLEPDDEEYTCGLYRSLSGEVRSITFKRKLQGGLSGSGKVVVHPAIDKLLDAVAVGLDLKGSINVQLRLTDRGPYIFEINPRFSSTVLFRHLLGFCDVVWSIEELMGRTLAAYSKPVVGSRFYRASSEYIEF